MTGRPTATGTLLLLFFNATAIYSVTMVLWKEDRISSLQSHGKALEKECCLPGVFCDGDTPSKLLFELNGQLV